VLCTWNFVFSVLGLVFNASLRLGFAACCEEWLCLSVKVGVDIGLRPPSKEGAAYKFLVVANGKAQPFLTTGGEAESQRSIKH
jgi:hypothetical protein